MGWNQVRITFYPLGWKAVIRKVQRGRGDGQKDYFLREPERDSQSEYIPISGSSVERWLLEREFTMQRTSTTYLEYSWEDITLFGAIDTTEVTELELTFTLAPSSWSRLSIWLNFVDTVANKWGLRPVNPANGQFIATRAVRMIIQSHPNWTDFSSQFGWPLIGKEDEE